MPFTFKPLWKKLIDLDMTKEELRKKLCISSSTLARMRKDEYIFIILSQNRIYHSQKSTFWLFAKKPKASFNI